MMIIMSNTRKQVFIILKKKKIKVKDFNDNDCNYKLVWRTVMIITLVTDCHDICCDCKIVAKFLE